MTWKLNISSNYDVLICSLDSPRECCVTMFFVYNSFGPRSARRIHVAVRAESGIAYSCAWSIRTLKRICYFHGCTSSGTIASIRLREAVYNNKIATSQSRVVGSRDESEYATCICDATYALSRYACPSILPSLRPLCIGRSPTIQLSAHIVECVIVYSILDMVKESKVINY